MPQYCYRAVNSRGAGQRGVVEAPSPDQAAAQLRASGLFPISLDPAEEGRSGASGRWIDGRFPGRVSRRDLAVFTRQLATLLRAGMPLVRALEVLARQERRPASRRMMRDLAERLHAGGSLSEAMAAQPGTFAPMYIGMVRAGEAGGALEAVLERLARFAEKSLQLRGKVKSALIYPAVVLAVAAAVLGGLLLFVVPRFQQIFADLLRGAPLPPLTQAVLDFSGWVRQHGSLAIGLLAAAGLGPALLGKTTAGRRWLDAAMLGLPVFGPLATKAVIARFARTFGTLLSSGVPILGALEIARETCGNAQVAAALAVVHARVKAGEPVARPLEDTGCMPPMVVSLVDVGEQSGQLPAMLGRIADIYEEEVDNAVAGLGSLLEPFLILFLAGVVGTIVVALFLPIVRIVQLLT